MPRLGVVVYQQLGICGNLCGGALIDHFGLMDADVQRDNPLMRYTGIALAFIVFKCSITN